MFYLKVFFEFFKVGLFTFGGGLASIPFFYDISDRLGWFSYEQIANAVAIGGSTPGAVGVNYCTYLGYMSAGPLGGLLGALGFVAPSIIVVLIICRFINQFRDNKYVNAAFYGLRAASVALIAAALLSVIKLALLNVDAFQSSGSILALFNIPNIILAVVVFFVLKKWNPHPVIALGACAVVGIIFGIVGIY